MKNKLLFFLLLFANSAFTQNSEFILDYVPKTLSSFPSPNAESLGIFGQIPVSLYTGTPDIRIPIYELVEGDIKVPLSLAYHTSNRRVHTIPSWVGLGWTLDVGGVITRRVRGSADEDKTSLQNLYDMRRYDKGYMHNHELWNIFNPSVPDPNEFRYFNVLNMAFVPLDRCGQNMEPIFLDHIPDEFSFNFMGYSGTFHYNGDSNRFMVISEDDITVIFDPETDIMASSSKQKIWHFMLVTPDGMKYDFGCKNNLSLPSHETTKGRLECIVSDEAVTTWYLTKITSPNGFVIEFEYEYLNALQQGGDIANLYPSYERMDYGFYMGINCPACSQTGRTKYTIDGQIINPIYLKKIKTSESELHFIHALSEGLNYKNSIKYHMSADYPNQSCGFNFFSGNYRKLDQITLYVKNTPVKRFDFTYINNPSERLKLERFQEHGLSDAATIAESKKAYIFEYNPNKMPDPGSDQTDHWEYANDFIAPDGSYKGDGRDFHLRKNPSSNPDVYLAEILEKITYPTGGWTEFTYEPHDYSKAVNEDKTGIISYSANQSAGGVRIKSIVSFDNLSSQNTSYKEYYYKKTNHKGSPINELSSGVLSGIPVYHMSNPGGMSGEPSYVFSSSPLTPLGDASASSHIGYSEVIEVEKTIDENNRPGQLTGYTVYEFTNFDEDCYGQSHMDGSPAMTIGGFFATRRSYIPGRRNFERGKILSKTSYRTDSVPVHRVQTRYETKFLGEKEMYSHRTLVPIPNCHKGLDISSGVLTTLNAVYLPQSETVTTWSTSGNDSLVTFSEYTYNNNRLLTQKTTINSEGDTITINTKYPEDYNFTPNPNNESAYALHQMKRNAYHQLNTVVEVRESINGMLRFAKVNTFGFFDTNTDRIKLKQDYFLETSSPLTSQNEDMLSILNGAIEINNKLRMQNSYERYDKLGNIRSFRRIDQVPVCLIFGYKNTVPIAYIQNADWEDIESVLGTQVLLALQNSTDENYICNQLHILRNHETMKKAHVFSYTYQIPFGIKSSTNPAGITTYYDYDNLGRLVSVKDNNLLILEKIYYNYK